MDICLKTLSGDNLVGRALDWRFEGHVFDQCSVHYDWTNV